MQIKKFAISHENKVKITAAEEKKTVEIGRQAIEAGLLNRLPGSCLALFLYLVSGADNRGNIHTNPSLISAYVPYDRQQIEDGLKCLQKEGIIAIEHSKKGDYTHKISLDLSALLSGEKKKDLPPQTKGLEAKKKVLAARNPKRKYLITALKSFIPEDGREIDVEKWIDDFDPLMIKELIRRVDKWFEHNDQQPSENRFYYLMGILDDWYSKEIFTYKRLRYYDRLYRETRELAMTYGIQKWYNLNTIQMNTFKSWVSGENGLSLSVAKLAIQEAIRRKKDGQPSLKYIEDNFIKPWQKAGIKNVQQARYLLNSDNNDQKTKQSTKNDRQNLNDKSKKQSTWDNFAWDFNLFVER